MFLIVTNKISAVRISSFLTVKHLIQIRSLTELMNNSLGITALLGFLTSDSSIRQPPEIPSSYSSTNIMKHPPSRVARR